MIGIMEKDELTEIEEWLGTALEDTLSDVIEVAMTRCKVKKSRRPHFRRVTEEAFKVALERSAR